MRDGFAPVAVTRGHVDFFASQPLPSHSLLLISNSILYELFTNADFSASGVPLLIACNKMDAAAARSVDAVRGILERELELLKTSRPSIASLADAGGPAGGSSLLLGQAGSPFTFAADAPVPTSWCGCSAAGNDAGEGVAAFAEARAAGRR